MQSTTYSVGSSSLPGHDIAYYGEQRNVADPSGARAYGGSVLTIFRGPFSTLHSAGAGCDAARAIHAAAAYDRIVREAYGVFASRRNYDVIVGIDSRGERQIGVLEQSWRFGGASMAEVLALEWLHAHPAAACVKAETVECYGTESLPQDAVLYWRGDAVTESPCKYARIVPDGCRA